MVLINEQKETQVPLSEDHDHVRLQYLYLQNDVALVQVSISAGQTWAAHLLDEELTAQTQPILWEEWNKTHWGLSRIQTQKWHTHTHYCNRCIGTF